MRILKLGVYYPAYLEQFYRARPSLGAEGYAVQHAALIRDGFGSADFWSAALRELGHVTTDLVINAEPLQRAWMTENERPWPPGEWPLAVALEQVKAFQPEVLLLADYSTVTYASVRQLQSECPSIRLTLIWCGAPYRNGEVFRACDVVLSCVPELVAHFREHGHRAEHLNHAFDPRLLERLPPDTGGSVDVSFLGSLVLADSFHRERARILEAVARETSLQIWSDITRPSLRRSVGQRVRILAFDAMTTARRLGIGQPVLTRLPGLGRVAQWPARPRALETLSRRLAARTRDPLYGLAMFGKLRESRVTLNSHIEISPRSASNMRMFEATGVGTCLLTDHKERLSDLFVPGAEVVTYASAAECAEQVRYLLDHESERASIAAAGQRRTLRDHTFSHRAVQLDAIITEALSGRSTLGRSAEAQRVASPVIAVTPSRDTETPDAKGVARSPLRSMAGRIRQVLRTPGRSSASIEEVERRERQFYRDFVRDGMVVFDVGAHVGKLTLLFSQAAAHGQVHAFEAGSRVFEQWCRQMRRRCTP